MTMKKYSNITKDKKHRLLCFFLILAGSMIFTFDCQALVPASFREIDDQLEVKTDLCRTVAIRLKNDMGEEEKEPEVFAESESTKQLDPSGSADSISVSKQTIDQKLKQYEKELKECKESHLAIKKRITRFDNRLKNLSADVQAIMNEDLDITDNIQKLFDEREKINSLHNSSNTLLNSAKDALPEAKQTQTDTVSHLIKAYYSVYDNLKKKLKDSEIRLQNTQKTVKSRILEKLSRQEKCEEILMPKASKESPPIDQLQSILHKELKWDPDCGTKGCFQSDKVFHALSELSKDNKRPKRESDIIQMNLKLERRKNKIDSCYRQKIGNIETAYYEGALTHNTAYNKATSNRFHFVTKLQKWKKTSSEIKQLGTELEQLNSMYKERLRLLTHSFLVFTIANSSSKAKHFDYINRYYRNSSITALEKEVAAHFLKKEYKKEQSETSDENKFLKILIDNVKTRSREANTEKILFSGIESNAVAVLQKFKKHVVPPQMNTKNNNPKETEDAIPGLINSMVFYGDQDMNLTREGNELKCRNCLKLQQNVENFQNLALKYDLSIGMIKKEDIKIRRFIYETDRENFQMMREFDTHKRAYTNAASTKRGEIAKKKNTIRDIVSELEQLHKILFNADIKVNTSTEELIDWNSKSNKMFINKLRKKIYEEEQKRMYDVQTYNKSQPHLKTELVEVTVDLQHNKEDEIQQILNDELADKYSSVSQNACFIDRHRQKKTINGKVTSDTIREKRREARVTSIDIPYIFIKDGEKIRSFIFDFAIKVICQSIDFKYISDLVNKEIVNTESNIAWSADLDDELQKRNVKTNQAIEYSYEDYIKFCDDYNNWYIKHQDFATSGSWFKPKCRKPFSMQKKQDLYEIKSYRGTRWEMRLKPDSYGKIADIDYAIIPNRETLEKLLSTFHRYDKTTAEQAKIYDQFFWVNESDSGEYRIVKINKDGTITRSWERSEPEKMKVYSIVRIK